MGQMPCLHCCSQPGIGNALSHPGPPQAFSASWPLALCSSPSAATSTTSSTRPSGSAASGTMCCECRAGGWGLGDGSRRTSETALALRAVQHGSARHLSPTAGETVHVALGAQDVNCSVIYKHGKMPLLSWLNSALLSARPSLAGVFNCSALSCLGFPTTLCWPQKSL